MLHDRFAAVSALNTTEKSSRGSSYPDYKFAFSVGYSFLTIIVNKWSWRLQTPMQASKTRENKSIDDEGDDDDDEKFICILMHGTKSQQFSKIEVRNDFM